MFHFSGVYLFIVLLIMISLKGIHYDLVSVEATASVSNSTVIMHDPSLRAELVTEGLSFPTTMAFLGPNDILVLEKNNGTVQRIVNGTMLSNSILDVNVANKSNRGLLGIAVAQREYRSTYVFLYYTETKIEGSDLCPKSWYCLPGHDPLGNRLYRYELVNNKLVNPTLLLDLPAVPGITHVGGKVLIGPDNNIYLTVGDLDYRSNTQNFPSKTASNGTSAIYRITQDGKPVNAILDDEDPLNKYYAYGLRNSFGIDFDPVTGKLWDTENGPAFGDEINLVEPGFNSGWRKVQGIWETEGTYYGDEVLLNYTGFKEKVKPNPSGLEDFGGNGKYSAPEFIWFNITVPTAIKFFNTEKLGKQYQNDIVVGDYSKGNIYHFKLNQNRTELLLDGPLADKIANNPEELEPIKFGEGFGPITDIQVSPYDGYLYILSTGTNGKIFRIVSTTLNSNEFQ
jgi:aldose sugar dehydrogenase